MIIIASKQEKELLQSLRSLEKWDKADTVPALSAEVISLKKKIVELEISSKRDSLEVKTWWSPQNMNTDEAGRVSSI